MILFVLVFVAVFQLGYGMEKKEAIELCIKQYGIGQDVLQNYMQNGEVLDENDKNQKCVFQCLLNKMGMSDDNGNMDMTKIKEMMVAKYNKMNSDDVLALMDKCAVRTETDACDKVYYFHKCHMKPKPSIELVSTEI